MKHLSEAILGPDKSKVSSGRIIVLATTLIGSLIALIGTAAFLFKMPQAIELVYAGVGLSGGSALVKTLQGNIERNRKK